MDSWVAPMRGVFFCTMGIAKMGGGGVAMRYLDCAMDRMG